MPAPKHWAPFVWGFLHYTASAFPSNAPEGLRKEFVTYIEYVAKFLLCGVCSFHMQEYMKKHPLYPHTDKKESVERYFYDLHEDVNNRTGVPKDQRPSFEVVQKAYREGKNTDQLKYPVSLTELVDTGVLSKKALQLERKNPASTPMVNNTNNNVILILLITCAVILGVTGVVSITALSIPRRKSSSTSQ